MSTEKQKFCCESPSGRPDRKSWTFSRIQNLFFSFFLVWLFNHLRRAVRRVCTLTFVRPLQCTAIVCDRLCMRPITAITIEFHRISTIFLEFSHFSCSKWLLFSFSESPRTSSCSLPRLETRSLRFLRTAKVISRHLKSISDFCTIPAAAEVFGSSH